MSQNNKPRRVGLFLALLGFIAFAASFLLNTSDDIRTLLFLAGGLVMIVGIIMAIVEAVKGRKAQNHTNPVTDSRPSAPVQPVQAPTPSTPASAPSQQSAPVFSTAAETAPSSCTTTSAASSIPEPASEPSNVTSITNPMPAPKKAQHEPTHKKCRRCGRRGFGVHLDQDGYCPSCAKLNAEYLERETREQEARKRKEEQTWEKIQAIPPYNFTPSDTRRKRNSGYDGVVFSNITPKGKYNDIVVFDTETTGLSPSRDRIIELAAIRYKDGKPVLRFHTYINPERPIPPEVSQINGITDDMVTDAPTISSVLPVFEIFIGDSMLIAHNLNFDLRFLYYSGCNVLDTKRKYIDTLEQAQKLVKKPQEVDNHKLDTLCQYYGITIASHHSALADAYATGELFFCLVDEKQNILRE